MGETKKSYQSRTEEDFFNKYIKGQGIDIGVGRLDTYDGEDLVHESAFPWDKDNGDATFMSDVKNESFDYVHASHVLEHISNPYLALRNWLRILKPQGHLIILVPHRDLYEKKKELPSRWNADHKFFILMDEEELPYTLNLTRLLHGAFNDQEAKIEYIKIRANDWSSSGEYTHSLGEYSIEAVIRKF